MKFLPVAAEEVPDFRESRRGRVCYPIIKGFLESNMPLAKLDREGLLDRRGDVRSAQNLFAGLTSYIRTHKMPIKLFTRNGELYLLRLDLNEDGTPNPDYVAPPKGTNLSLKAPDALHEDEDSIPSIEEVLSKRKK